MIRSRVLATAVVYLVFHNKMSMSDKGATRRSQQQQQPCFRDEFQIYSDDVDRPSEAVAAGCHSKVKLFSMSRLNATDGDQHENKDQEAGENTTVGTTGQGDMRSDSMAYDDQGLQAPSAPPTPLPKTNSEVIVIPSMTSVAPESAELPAQHPKRRLQTSSTPNSPNTNNIILYDDDFDDAYAQMPTPPASTFSPNNHLTLYDPNTKGYSGSPGQRYENPVIANGVLGWIGTNMNALKNYFTSPGNPAEPASLLAELAQANMEYVTGGLPNAVMQGLAEKKHRVEEMAEQQQRWDERGYEHQLQRQRGQNGDGVDMIEGMGFHMSNAENSIMQSRQEETPMEQQLRMNSALPIQQQLYYQQLLYQQQQEKEERSKQSSTTMAGMQAANQQGRRHNNRRGVEKDQRRLHRHILASVLKEVASAF